MAIEVLSWVAVAVIVAAIAVAWSRRFLALGALAVANGLVFALQALGPTAWCGSGPALAPRPVIHCDLALRGDLLAAGEPQAFLQLLTSMFVHADFFHLFGNLLILVAFSLPFEERIGARPFLAIYLATGLAGALAQNAQSWGDPIFMMGASGAVLGIVGAFAGAFPRLVVPVPLPLLVIMIWVRTQVWKAAAAFAAVNLVFQFLSDPSGGGVAYLAHLGGLAAGIVLGAAYVRRRAHEPVRQHARATAQMAGLGAFARDAAARRALEEMERSRLEPEVFAAWRDRFLRHATCPACGASVQERERGLACANGHEFDLRAPITPA